MVVPNYSSPLGYCMPDERKRRLVALLTARDIPLIEDDIYGDLGFAQRRPPICRSLPEAAVLHRASFSKALSSNLPIGWIAPGPMFSATQNHRNYTTISCACAWRAFLIASASTRKAPSKVDFPQLFGPTPKFICSIRTECRLSALQHGTSTDVRWGRSAKEFPFIAIERIG